MPNLLELPSELRDMILKEVLADFRIHHLEYCDNHRDSHKCNEGEELQSVEWITADSLIDSQLSKTRIPGNENTICNKLPPIAEAHRQLRTELLRLIHFLPNDRRINFLVAARPSSNVHWYFLDWSCASCSPGQRIHTLTFNIEFDTVTKAELNELISCAQTRLAAKRRGMFEDLVPNFAVISRVLHSLIDPITDLRGIDTQIRSVVFQVDVKQIMTVLSPKDTPVAFQAWWWLRNFLGTLCAMKIPFRYGELSTDFFGYTLLPVVGVNLGTGNRLPKTWFEQSVHMRQNIGEIIVKEVESQILLLHLESTTESEGSWSARLLENIPHEWKTPGEDALLEVVMDSLEIDSLERDLCASLVSLISN